MPVKCFGWQQGSGPGIALCFTSPVLSQPGWVQAQHYVSHQQSSCSLAELEEMKAALREGRIKVQYCPLVWSVGPV